MLYIAFEQSASLFSSWALRRTTLGLAGSVLEAGLSAAEELSTNSALRLGRKI